MRIALVYDAIYPYVKGGAERRYYELARVLCSHHEVHLFGMKFWEGNSLIQNSDGVFLHGVCPPKQLYVDGRRSIYQAIYFSFHLIIPLLKWDFDLVDCSSVPFFPTFVCKLYAMLRRRPLVVTWHEYWGDYWYTYLSSGWKGFLAKSIESASSKLPDRIVAVSEHTKADLELHGVPADKIQVVHNAIGFDEIQPLPIASTASDLIFAGRLVKNKNVDILILAIHLLSRDFPQIKCFIVGNGPERRNLEKLRRELQLEPNVEFVGFLHDHNAVYSLMKASKVFVLPSEREGFGMVVLEANACGLPVVVAKARHSAATLLTKHGESGFICDLDVKAIADAVNRLLTDDALRARMQQSAVAWAQCFDWKVMAEKADQVYQELLVR